VQGSTSVVDVRANFAVERCVAMSGLGFGLHRWLTQTRWA
jgi:hypothetical protein